MSAPEPTDLLAALQRSVDAAKADARQREEPQAAECAPTTPPTEGATMHETTTLATKYGHEIEPHPCEGETAPLGRLVRYHYAQAIAWHRAFAETITGASQAERGQIDFTLAQYLGHAQLAFLHDALHQGLASQEAADWASVRNHSESAELVWERAVHYGINPDEIRAYETRRKADR
ncbi:hypothetical protein [Nocardioides sp. LML1-1-1.1]|uniref:hypothetical protein n=1 Tax=Nocardioides sp. LML1-1-1.1 TaxID=3135248 RepID=UPI00344317C8